MMRRKLQPRTLHANASRTGEIHFGAVPVQLRAGANNDGPPAFEIVAYNGGAIDVGWGMAVVVDLAGMRAGKTVPILLEHDQRRIVGHSTEVNNDRSSLRLSGVASGANEDARQVIESGKFGFPWQASIGASIVRTVEVKAGKTVTVNGQTFAGPILVARESKLKEVSFVSLGADETTSVKIAAGAAGVEAMGFKEWLLAKGFVEAELSETALATLRATYDAEIAAAAGGQGNNQGNGQGGTTQQAAPANPPAMQAGAQQPTGATPNALAENLQQTREAMAAEHTRIAQVTDAAGPHADLVAEAIRGGWSVERTRERRELLELRAERPQAPAGHVVPRDRETVQMALQASSLLSAGVALDHAFFGSSHAMCANMPDWARRSVNDEQRQRAMEAAHRYRRMSTYELACQCLILDGRGALVATHNREEIMKAALTGGSFSNVLTTDVNALLLIGYMDTVDTTAGWVQEEEVADFRQQDRVRLTKGRGMRKHKRGGTAEQNDRSDTGVNYKLGRYSEKIEFDEQDIIDDRLSVLTEGAREMGEDAKLIRPDLVYYLLLSNPTFSPDSTAIFHANHGNLQTTSALTEATLKSAIGLMEKQQENGRNLQIRASGLLVPVELKHTAAGLLQSDTIITGSDISRGNANTIKSEESIRRISDSRLSNGVTDPDSGTTAAGSATTWYMVGTTHTIRVGYLRGRGRQPVVRSYPLTEGRWGQGWDANFDIGAAWMDYRGANKSTA